MVDVQTISIAIASAGVFAATVYYVLEIRHQSRIRQTESVLRLSPWFRISAKEMQEAINEVCSIEYKDYHDYLEKYYDKKGDMKLKVLGNYFEGVGILVYRRLVTPNVVYDFWGAIIETSWEKIMPLIADMRKDSGNDNVFRYWEYLYNEMKKREQRGA